MTNLKTLNLLHPIVMSLTTELSFQIEFVPYSLYLDVSVEFLYLANVAEG